MDTEIWQPIIGPYRPGYEVSSRGRVRGSKSTRDRNSGLCSTKQSYLRNGEPGYCKVSLMLADGITRKFVSVHRLVAIAFIPGDYSLDVNHKDLDKTNNHWTNLEWVTHAENIRHGMANHPTWTERIRTHGVSLRRPVIASKDGIETRYGSLTEAGKAMGSVNGGNIGNAIKLGRNWYGREWRYA